MSNRALLISVIFIVLVSFAVLRKNEPRPGSVRENITAASVTPILPNTSARAVQATPSPPPEPDNPLNHLEYKIDFNSFVGDPPQARKFQEKSLRPDDLIGFNLEVSNRGSGVIDGLKVIIQPAEYLYLEPFREDSVFDRAMHKEHVRYDQEDKVVLKDLTTTGYLVTDYQGKSKLFPKGNPYYQENVGLLHFTLRFEGRLKLNPRLRPGQDVYFQVYLVYQRHKVHIGTLIVHVMYSDDPPKEVRPPSDPKAKYLGVWNDRNGNVTAKLTIRRGSFALNYQDTSLAAGITTPKKVKITGTWQENNGRIGGPGKGSDGLEYTLDASLSSEDSLYYEFTSSKTAISRHAQRR